MIDFCARKLSDINDNGISEVYFAIDGKFFPGAGWTDFDRAIKIWEKGIGPNGSDGILFFMDGPYYFSIKKQSNGTYNFTFMKKECGEYFDVISYVSSEEEFINLVDKIREYATYC